jgi:lipopolysaccharide biosynthesis glycosyltransferase
MRFSSRKKQLHEGWSIGPPDRSVRAETENVPQSDEDFFDVWCPNLFLLLFLSVVFFAIKSSDLLQDRHFPSMSNPIISLTKRGGESIFFFIVTRNDNRLEMGLTAVYSMLNHISPSSYSFSVNIISCDPGIPPGRDADFKFLASIHRDVPIFVHNISQQNLNCLAGTKFPWERPLTKRQIPGRNIAALRLFIPFLFTADWFIYTDDDVFFRRDFFPEVMEYTKNQSKVLYAVRDHFWFMGHRLRRRMHRYDKAFVGPYFGNGFFLVRGNEIARREMKKTIEYFSQHMELQFVEQDAMNLAFDWNRVELLPVKFCVVGSEHGVAWDWAYGFHYTAIHKKTKVPFIKSAIQNYLARRDRWNSDSRSSASIMRVEAGISSSKFIAVS